MTQSQSSVIKFSSFIFLPSEVSDSKTTGGGHVPPTCTSGGNTNAFVPQLFHATKSVFCHQVQFFYFSTSLKSVIAKPREGGTSPQHLHKRGALMLLFP